MTSFPAVLYRAACHEGMFSTADNFRQKENAMVYLQITLKVRGERRAKAAEVYQRYKEPFLTGVPGARSKDLLVRDDDVQVLHGFDSTTHAEAYLKSRLFEKDVVTALTPLLDAAPDVRVYTVA
jgi:hypothetical protein